MTATLPNWMTTTAPLDFLDPSTWVTQPRDEHGRWITGNLRARRRELLAAADAGTVHLTVFDLPEDPDTVRESLFGGAVVVYRPIESTTIRVTPRRPLRVR